MTQEPTDTGPLSRCEQDTFFVPRELCSTFRVGARQETLHTLLASARYAARPPVRTQTFGPGYKADVAAEFIYFDVIVA
jgi:hypothetical protein